jgi:phospho-N-acetylmuramoyl-pentapeptide-transferase
MVNLILSFIITFILGIIIVPKLRSYNIGQIVREDGPKEHLKKTGTPTMGGIIILIVIITILIINSFEFPILILPIISILGFGLVGFIDDYKKLVLKNTEGLSPKKKIIGLFLTIIVFLIFYLKVFDLSTEILIPYFNIGINLSLIVFILFTTFIMLRNFKCS